MEKSFKEIVKITRYNRKSGRKGERVLRTNNKKFQTRLEEDTHDVKLIGNGNWVKNLS